MMQSSLLLNVPKEIRFQILEYLIDFSNLQQGRWLAQPLSRINRQLRDETSSVIYGTRDLIFDLPDFTPHNLSSKLAEWPSRFYIRDQYSTFLMKLTPKFLHSGVFDSESENVLETLKKCPFHSFRSIRIQLTPPDAKDPDSAKLIMDWNRLHFITRILRLAKNGLPQVTLVLSGDSSSGYPHRSWFDIQGKPICSHPDISKIKTFDAVQVSDLLLVIGALIPLRRASSIVLQEPSPKLLDDECLFCLEDLQESAVKRCDWGQDQDDEDWIRWLDLCELRFHRLLQKLKSPVAPFLRLEQLASLTHFERYKYETLYPADYNFTEEDVEDTFDPLINYAFVLSPRQRFSACPHSFSEIPECRVEGCPCESVYKDPRYNYITSGCPAGDFFYCPSAVEYLLWSLVRDYEMIGRSNEQAQLEAANRAAEIKWHDLEGAADTRKRQQIAETLKRLTRCGRVGKSAGKQEPQHRRKSDTGNSDACFTLGDREQIAYNSCRCLSGQWIETYPNGVVHDPTTIEAALKDSTCPSARIARASTFRNLSEEERLEGRFWLDTLGNEDGYYSEQEGFYD